MYMNWARKMTTVILRENAMFTARLGRTEWRFPLGADFMKSVSDDSYG
jgi:hypothetical protein